MGRTSPTVVDAYAVVPGDEHEATPHAAVDGTATAAVAVVEELNQPAARSVPTEYETIPEARGLKWRDDFFEDHIYHDDIVAVFDFDYETMESHYKCLGWSAFVATSVCVSSAIPWLLVTCVPCILNRNVEWNVRSRHVALTRTGVVFVHDKRPVCWGDPYCSIGKRTKVIPYDQITDFACANNGTLSTVKISTNASGKKGIHDLEITGLQRPYEFKKLALALKRTNGLPIDITTAAASTLVSNRLAAMVMEDRNGGSGNSNINNDEVSTLLREIRDELRQNNDALRNLSTEPRRQEDVIATVIPSDPLDQDE